MAGDDRVRDPFEQKSTTRPIQQPTVQKAASPTTTTQTAAAQRPAQQVDTSLSHVGRDVKMVGVVTLICLVALVVRWAVLR